MSALNRESIKIKRIEMMNMKMFSNHNNRSGMLTAGIHIKIIFVYFVT